MFLWAGCRRVTVQQFGGAALGTTFHIAYVGEPDTALPRQVDSVLRHINSTFSIFDTTSLVSRVNAGEETALDEDFLQVLRKALEVSAQTGGAFDCTVHPLVELWGFGCEGRKEVVSQAALDSVRQFVGSRLLHLQDDRLVKDDTRVRLDFNAIAKGFAADRVARFLKEQGYADCIVEIGGEVVACGAKNGRPWRVGVSAGKLAVKSLFTETRPMESAL